MTNEQTRTSPGEETSLPDQPARQAPGARHAAERAGQIGAPDVDEAEAGTQGEQPDIVGEGEDQRHGGR